MSNNNQNKLEQQLASTFLFGGSAAYLEEQYENYLRDPNSVAPEWRTHFDAFPKVNGSNAGDVSHTAIKDFFVELATDTQIRGKVGGQENNTYLIKELQVAQLIDAYRSLGHRIANLDPLGLREFPLIPALELSQYGLSDADLSTEFVTNSFKANGKKKASLAAIMHSLKDIYCRTLGLEYTYMTDPQQIAWIQEYIEPCCGKPQLSKEEKLHIFKMLTAAEGLERYLGTRFVGQKRFSLEGGDSFIPMMDELVQRSARHGVKEVAIGMAHRGRLNVLVNILGKAPAKLFDEFEGRYEHSDLSGDVKYHKGYASSVKTEDGVIHLALGFNPSHLEIIAPVVEGAVRARQDRRDDPRGKQVMPIIVHGDAAFAGQGVVMETFALSHAEGFSTGGSVHIVINNQIGFTTNNRLDTNHYSYSTDVAKMVQAPIIHVNGDDPEAVIMATRLALDFRMAFEKDVVIDLVCYRRMGHNEADEPMMTQPVVYQNIKKHETTLTLYGKQLVAENLLKPEEVKALSDEYRVALEKGHPVVNLVENYPLDFASDWTPYWNQPWDAPVNTGLPLEVLKLLGERINAVPAELTLQPQVGKEYEFRRAMIAGEVPLHWGMAETLAYASLLNEGMSVRLTGQDSQRGTFSHRHAVLHDVRNDKCYTPLQHISDDQGFFAVYNTILSEEAVLGFEYGYASADPETLTIWEAQFGDFYNGAQVLVDQFLSSSEQKWGLLCGLVMFLPHALEAMGPEHSSARLERFLQLCAQDNMQVVVPTTPAQCFHMLRRQMLRKYRKPLIVMTPKGLLRHKMAVSSLTDLSEGSFLPVIDETDKAIAANATKLIITSGKVYYELIQERSKLGKTDTAIIRLEQLYPFPKADILRILKSYVSVKSVMWCQDEAENQGAWFYCKDKLRALLNHEQSLDYAARPEAAAPAVGLAHVHEEQQRVLLEKAFN
ncbi:MAG: 2-oxoglutarate dehydrogenase E1 component [Legionellales bacterium]|nr:2-oxoglutarate dehydrogenase E1 component [Legionellales bacterium]